MCALSIERYLDLKQQVIDAGHSDDIDWAESILKYRECVTPCTFVREYIFVVVNSGMKAQVAQKIFRGIMYVVAQGRHPVTRAFKHPGKAAAIERSLVEGVEWWDAYKAAEDKLAYLETLPWIGPITKYHLAKNLGADVAKPDRHLLRIAGSKDQVMPMCRRLSEATGDSVAVVDTVVWRAANLGLV